jgi:sarcosine oxidase subunit beta
LTPASRHIVVGAGIVGLSSALHLLHAGEPDVWVVDAGSPGNGTTPAGAGFVAPWATVMPHLGATGLALENYSIDFYRRLHDATADIAFRANGNIVFFNSAATRDAGVGAIMSGPLVTPETRVVDADEIADLTSGAVDPGAIAGGVLMPGGIQLETG